MIMRNLIRILIVSLTAITPALASETYVNQRYGASALVPDGFEAEGVEASNSDGLRFKTKAGNAILTIFGAPVSGSFENYIDEAIAFDQSYYGWVITSKTVTPDWAEYTGHIGSQFLSVRTLLTCNGTTAISTRMEYRGEMKSTVSKVEASLKSAKC